MFIQNDSNINSQLTELYKKQIKDKDLVSSGKLLNSISCALTLQTDGAGKIVVKALEYLKYLDEKNKISEDFLNDIQTIDIIEDVVVRYIDMYLMEENSTITNLGISLEFDFA